MKKHQLVSKVLFCISIIIAIIMVIYWKVDYKEYIKHPEYSAAFLVYFMFKGLIYSILIVINLVLSFVFRRRASN